MRIFNYVAAVTGMIVLVCSQSMFAAIAGIERVATGLNFPGFATHAPGDASRLFIAELGGNIKILDLETNSITGTFLNIPDTGFIGEGGLLGLAFHPDYFSSDISNPGRGKFYVYVTVDNNTSAFASHIREYSVDPNNPNIALPASKREILQFAQPQTNHNAGWIGFNPKTSPSEPQYLYIMSGDGGGGGDDDAGHTPAIGNAQDTTNNLLGKVLRIDVNGDDFTGANDPNDIKNYAVPSGNPFSSGTGDDEIWSYGLRNPYRASFDRKTGDLWIGDVGQGAREEIDFQPASKTSVSNYGWRLWEGNVPFGANPGDPFPPNYVAPIYDYTRGSGAFQGETVIGGYRYRGPDPDLQGLYFFGDASDDNVWQMTPPDPVAPNNNVINIDGLLENLAGIDRIVSFAEDANGNLYIIDMATGPNSAPNPNTGDVWRIVTDNLLAGDYNADGTVDAADYVVWRKNDGSPAGYDTWQSNFGASVHSGAGAGAVHIPEPISAMLMISGLAVATFCCCRSRQDWWDRVDLQQTAFGRYR